MVEQPLTISGQRGATPTAQRALRGTSEGKQSSIVFLIFSIG
jgi:hypothetical protein